MFRVTIDPIRSEKDLQIPEEMSDNERDQDDTGHGHNHLFADRRAKKKLLKHSRYKHVTGTVEGVVLTALPDKCGCREFQIMDAGWSVKLPRLLLAARVGPLALRFFARKTFLT